MEKLIYIADDDNDIRKLVKIFLESEGYNVLDFENGDTLFEEFKKIQCDLAILDIMMPGTDGLTICNKIRNISNIPIIILTAKDSDADYVAGITLGSDDYIVKPFRPTVLNMKIKSLFRRIEMSDSKKESTEENIVCGNMEYDMKQVAIYIDKKEVALTKTELACLKYLMVNYKRAISREELLDKIWGFENSVETRVTDETVRRIRKKIKLANANQMIKNKWGYGYILKGSEDIE